MSESTIQREIMLAVSKTGARVFRNNVAEGWVGNVFSDANNGDGRLVILHHARPLHAGLCVGSADLIGWTADGRFLSIEVKSKTGRVTEEQKTFLAMVRASGGVAIIARSVEEALEGLK